MTLDMDELSETQQEALKKEGLEIEGVNAGGSESKSGDEENISTKEG